MITVTAAIIEKNGLILAARRKPGVHLAGYWEFPGGKREDGETSEECLARELREEFDIKCAVGEFFGESIYDYGTKVIRLLGYRVLHLHGTFKCRDHDQISWLPAGELSSLTWAPADIPLVVQLQEEHHVMATLAYYRNNAREYVEETVAFDVTNAMRRRFAAMLAPGSHILDLGCGSGRDSRFFIDQGHRVTPVDAVAEIASQAAQYLARPVRVQKAEELNETDTYDGIWACASLLHIPRSRIHETFACIITAMRHQGIWYMSFKQGEMEYKDHKQRFFSNYSIPLMKQLLVQFPQIKLLEMSESTSILRGDKQLWLNVLIKKL
jgi:mutator protein MutT